MKKGHDEQNYNECINSAKKVIEFDGQSKLFVLRSQTFICICQSKVNESCLVNYAVLI